MSLQKESEWEKEFDEMFGVIHTPDYDGGIIPFSEQYSADDYKSFIKELLSTREKEIAEEVEKKCQTGYQVASGRIEETDAHGYSTAIKDVLSIIKH